MFSGARIPAGGAISMWSPYFMDYARKYLTDYFKYKLASIIGGVKNYENWKAKNYSLKTVELKNKELAQGLEVVCRKNGGLLTYAEFLQIDQFGTHGYHSKHKDHGMTDVPKRWGKAIATLCREKGISHVLEFGPGAGDLAIELLKEARKKGSKIKWSGVEINEELQGEIRRKFKKNGFEKNLQELTSNLEKLKTKEKSLVVFSYSLDSVPPHVFLNTGKQKKYPDSLLGINVEKGILKELILNAQQLREKGITLKNAVFSQNGIKFNFSSWLLYPGQRAYVSVPAFQILSAFTQRFPNSIFLVIDEVRSPAYTWETRHFCIPKDLHRYKRDVDDLEKGYREAGENLLYYPTYFTTFYKLLHSLGFRSIAYEIEQKMSRDLSGDKWLSLKEFFLTYSFLASNKTGNQKGIVNLEFPQAKLF